MGLLRWIHAILCKVNVYIRRIAQLVERVADNHKDGGSNPPALSFLGS